MKQKKISSACLLAFILMFVCVRSVFAWNDEYYQSTKLSVNKTNIALVDLFSYIEQNSDYLFFYKDSDVKNIKVSMAATNQTINHVLDTALKNTKLTYSLSGRNVNIIQKKAEGQQQKRKYKGVVKDGSGNPIIGANVLVENSNTGVITDIDGNFDLEAEQGAVLKISYIGYLTQSIKLGNKQNLSVVLKEDTEMLDEVVVVGFGTQKKVNLTGSVESVSVKDINKRLVGQTSLALQGLVPGVSITQRSGQPGRDGGTISVRGKTTLGNNDVLVLVDGVEMGIDDIDPSLIESISVLKDAASAAIYGSRAANGVILITTKRAETDKFDISYSGRMGWQRAIELPKKVGALDHMRMLDLANTNVGNSPIYSSEKIEEYAKNMTSNPDLYPDTDWYDLCLTNSGFTQDHFITLSGGSKRIRTIANLGYMSQAGIIANSDYKRYTFRINSDMELMKNLTARLDAHVIYGKREEPSNPDIFNWLSRIPANESGILSNGKWGKGWNGYNPLAMAKDGGTSNVKKPDALFNFSLIYKPIKDLTIQATYSPHYYEVHQSIYEKSIRTYNADGSLAYTAPEQSSLSESTTQNMRQQFTASATYDKTFGVHGITALLGYQQDSYRYDIHGGSRLDFPFSDFPVLDAGGIEGQKSTGTAKEFALQSVFGRLNYSLFDRYLFEANVRFDASSRFAKGHRNGVFPSFSMGWRVSEEKFWVPLKSVVSNLKFRVSWGQLGNQNVGDYYPFASLVNIEGINYIFNNKGVSGAAITNMANKDITWETTTVTDFGIDATLWNKLNVSFDYYYKKTKDILLQLDVPLIIGLNAPMQNAGVVENRGWDLSLSYNDKIGDFTYRAAFNISDVRNKILDMKGVNQTGLLVNREGEEMNSIYGFKAIGYIQPEDYDANGNYKYAKQFGNFGPGDIRYEDVKQDGFITSEDRQILGGTIPRYTYGLSLYGAYKGFDLSMLFQGVGKANGYIEGHGIQPFFEGGTVQEQHKDYWTNENRNAKFPRLAFNETNNIQYSSFWMKNAAYCRLKNLQVGYTLPKKWTEKCSMENVRIYFSGDNLFTISDFWKGFDVEAPVGNGNYYPQVKTISFGIDVKF